MTLEPHSPLYSITQVEPLQEVLLSFLSIKVDFPEEFWEILSAIYICKHSHILFLVNYCNALFSKMAIILNFFPQIGEVLKTFFPLKFEPSYNCSGLGKWLKEFLSYD